MKKLSIISLVLCFFQYTQAQLLFEERAATVGITASCGDTFMGNGISFVDYDQDGWDDISLTTGEFQSVRFFKNNNGTFIEDFPSLPNTLYQTKCITWVDFDNDGDKDIFLTSDTDGNKLLENNGSMVFQDITVAAGLPISNMFSFGASWGDIDNDGHLDLYVCNRDPNFLIKNSLFHNNGDGTFSDISSSAGVDISQLSFCSAFLDYNNDGFQDIYVANDRWFTSNYLFKNNGDGTFDDVSQISGTDLEIDAMSVTVDDYNADGWLDIYVTNNPSGNALLKNNGDGTFTDVAASTGTGFYSHGWGAVFFDAENDMDLDLYVSGSYTGTNPDWVSAEFYERTGPELFETPENVGFLNDVAPSYSNAIGDVNNDGLPEILVNNINNQAVHLWSNQTTTSNNWLKIRLEGTTSNRDGIGSQIEIGIGGDTQFRYTLCGEGYLSQNSNVETFGLGSNMTVDYVKVTWLSGIVDYVYNVGANQVLNIEEGSGTLATTEEEFAQVQLFPNPVDDLIKIKSNQYLDQVNIIDILGKQQESFQCKAKECEADVSSLSSGLYFVQITSDIESGIIKFIKR